MKRREMLAGIASVVPAVLARSAVMAQEQADNPISRDSVLRDPDIPLAGNLAGDVTIVEYFDYQCPHCKRIAPILADVVKEDGRIRLVLKDWPIFGELSVQSARLVLGAKFQGKFHDAYYALMGTSGKLTEARLMETLKQAGVSLEELHGALETHDEKLKSILKRNSAQAEAFGFNGTPSFIVGTFRVPGVPTAEQFKMMIADVRAGKDKTGR
ncbi:DsbA family protein [Bradyrhizobium sp. LHD-71]|uniref:DsbA family protein n=1 Tax=Bradyrhizobium sp. LHD-71 TaxID=3072141 RepID=UPI00280C8838|nr:DsbA family protein [Bradyrhizobium sp. LHD-71]MDQ8730031.1 DsbA family protein [Bradyrhizobium sp. LHD-71]